MMITVIPIEYPKEKLYSLILWINTHFLHALQNSYKYKTYRKMHN